jgi:hypothetical protein
MGRYINCRINGEWKTAWKYVFGAQASEMSRIYEELEIGAYHPVYIQYLQTDKGEQRIYEYLETRQGAQADILILSRSDIDKINEWIEVLKEIRIGKKDQYFVAVLEAIRNFMTNYPEHNEFVFEGEF